MGTSLGVVARLSHRTSRCELKQVHSEPNRDVRRCTRKKNTPPPQLTLAVAGQDIFSKRRERSRKRNDWEKTHIIAPQRKRPEPKCRPDWLDHSASKSCPVRGDSFPHLIPSLRDRRLGALCHVVEHLTRIPSSILGVGSGRRRTATPRLVPTRGPCSVSSKPIVVEPERSI